MDVKIAHEVMVAVLNSVKGIEAARPLRTDDRQQIFDKEKKAEARSLMGLGKVINTGIREILGRDFIYAALTNMEFDWGCHATLVLKKGADIVGEEVRDEAMTAALAQKKDVWFLHKNFVVYKDKIKFPQDIMEKICHFEIPCLPAEFCIPEDGQFQCHSIHYANPSALSDLYLKEQYFNGLDEKGLGTILVGVKL